MAYWLSNDLKIIDLGGLWRSVLQQELYEQRVFPNKAFYCAKILRNAGPISRLVINDCSCLGLYYIVWQDDRVSPRAACIILALIVAVETSVPLT